MSEQKYNIAILGATGLVGQNIIEGLADRKFPVGELFPLGSERSAGETISFKGKDIEVLDAAEFDWSQVQIAIFSAGSDASMRYAPIAADLGVVVIDNTSFYRYEPEIPLVIPEVNPHALADFRNRNIIANPNCSTIQMLVALKPLHDAYGIDRINVSTYQSVSGAGKKGIDELVSQTAQLMNGRPVETEAFPVQMAFNVIPQIDSFEDNGYTREEMKMVWETHKIMGDESIRVNPTAVRVPVFYGHAESIHVELRQPVSAEDVKQLLEQAPGVVLMREDKEFPTQVSHASGQDQTFVGRVREDISHPNGINLWVVADNVRKGAATNSLQIAELLIKDYL